MTSSGPSVPQRASSKLRALISRGEPVVVPGALEPLTAMLIESLGYKCLCLGGTIVSAQLRVVEPLLMLPDVVAAARQLTRVTSLPLIVDGEHGFGDAIQAERMVHDYEEAGVAGAHLEDSRVPRRMMGSPMISMEQMVRKIKAAQAAKSDPDFLLICRTEAAGARVGGGIDEVRRRLSAYVEAGADALMPMVFDHDDAAAIGTEFRSVPLIYIAGSRRDTQPELSIPEIADMGYQIIFYASLGVSAALEAFRATFQTLQEKGSSGVAQGVHTGVWDVVESQIGTARARELEKADTDPA